MFVWFTAVTIGIDDKDGNECELSFELLARHRTRVLEFSQPLVGEGMQVGHTLTQGTLSPIGFGVLLTREPAKEVGRLVIEFVWDKMMTDTRLSGIGVCRTVAIESKRHKEVAGFTACTSFDRITTTALVPFLISWAKCVRNFLPLLIEKIAVWMRPANTAARVLCRY